MSASASARAGAALGATLLGAVALSLARASSLPERAPTRDGALAVVVGPSHGWLEPCGCSGGQLGGVHRLGAALSIAGQASARPVRVACGGVVADEARVNADWALAQLTTTWEAYGQLGFRAVGLSAAELSLGPELVLDVATLLAPGELVATNLVLDAAPDAALDAALDAARDAAPGAPLAPLVVDESGLAIAAFLPDGLSGPGWRTLTPERALERLEELGRWPHAGPLLVLVEGDEARVSAVARAVARPALFARHDAGDEASHELRALEAEGQSAGDVGARLRWAVRARVSADGAQHWEPHAVSESLPAREEEDRMRASYRELLHGASPPVVAQLADTLGRHSAGAFVGSERCLDCHVEEYRIWEETLHSHAFESLEADLRGAAPGSWDPRCIECHTVGFRYETGFGSARTSAATRFGPKSPLAAVGCESCHGPGERHSQTLATGDIDLGSAPIGGPSLCVRCHDSDNDPSFVFDKKWLQIRH
jgi:hypothetical protein